MLYGLSKQISHCYFRAAECRERAARCISPTEQQFYAEREQAWLTLAHSYELQERVSRMVKELKRSTLRGYFQPEPPPLTKPPLCPTCGVQMQFQTRRPVKHMLAEETMSFERALFACENCRRLDEQLIAVTSD
jgi:uncharacterized protein with PIN domain